MYADNYIQQTFTQNVQYDAQRDYWQVVENEKSCQARRDTWAKEMKAKGWNVKKSSHGWQLMSFGGIGSGKAHFEYWLKSYSATAWK